MTEIMQAHLVAKPEPLTRHRPTTPVALAGLVMRCLEKDPAHRPQDASAILTLLDTPALVSGAISTASVKSLSDAAARPMLRWRWAGAIAIVATVAIVGGMLARQGGAPTHAAIDGVSGPALPSGVAVLPMVSILPDASDAYLALGLTDEITGALSRVPGLRVTARSAAEAHAALGKIHSMNWRWRDAERSYRRALALDSTTPSSRLLLAAVLLQSGRHKVYLGLGESGRALDALTWATAARDAFFARESLASVVFDPLRDDTRFARVGEIVGLDAARLSRVTVQGGG